MNGINNFGSSGISNKTPVFSAPTEGTRGSVSAALNGEIVEPFESLPLEMKNELQDIVGRAQYQALRNPQWHNVRVVYYRGREPEIFDSVFPASRDISKIYEGVIDTTIIPIKIFEDGSCIYLIPTSIQLGENGGDEKRLINVT